MGERGTILISKRSMTSIYPLTINEMHALAIKKEKGETN